ncbi:MAG: hypothetical protein ACLP9L_02330 [Thermoguttaceae bacterium]
MSMASLQARLAKVEGRLRPRRDVTPWLLIPFKDGETPPGCGYEVRRTAGPVLLLYGDEDPETILERYLRQRAPGGRRNVELDGLLASWGWHDITSMERRKAESAEIEAISARRLEESLAGTAEVRTSSAMKIEPDPAAQGSHAWERDQKRKQRELQDQVMHNPFDDSLWEGN